MIHDGKIYIAEQFVPYENMALEQYLMDTVPKGTCILYLWQNQNTVVIGRNQNCWKECHVKELEQNGGFLARRLSGGGAVYHDLGNLNFTFLIGKEDYDVERQLGVILNAVASVGINAQKTGRNDITVDGKKISGNAFYFNGRNAYHHGTLLIGSDKEKAAAYLNVPVDKIRSKGVNSVKSRIVNLSEFCPGLRVELMKQKLAESFGQVYSCRPKRMETSDIDWSRVEQLRQKFAAPDWIYGRSMPFQYEFSQRFGWGGVTVRLNVESGMIADADVYSDAMDETFIAKIPGCLRGCAFSASAAAERLKRNFSDQPGWGQYCEDIEQLMIEQNF